jgi:hypothetical protein
MFKKPIVFAPPENKYTSTVIVEISGLLVPKKAIFFEDDRKRNGEDHFRSSLSKTRRVVESSIKAHRLE